MRCCIRLSPSPAPTGAGSAAEPPSDSHGEAPPHPPQTLLAARPRLTPRARVVGFQHDMEALYPKVLRGEVEEATPEPCAILIGKVRGVPRARLKRINDATARLLALCDGTRTLAAIVKEAAVGLRLSAAEHPVFAAECAQFLGTLVESELVELRAQGPPLK